MSALKPQANHQPVTQYLKNQVARKKSRLSQKNRANAFLRAVAELKSLQESINTPDTDEDAYGVFGRSVAMQLKKLSEESALLAQCRIQNILTEM
jgi:hypothetical protein